MIAQSENPSIRERVVRTTAYLNVIIEVDGKHTTFTGLWPNISVHPTRSPVENQNDLELYFKVFFFVDSFVLLILLFRHCT